MVFSKLFVFLTAFFLFEHVAVAQVEQDSGKSTLFQYLRNASLEECTLSFEIDSLIKNKFTANVYPAEVAFKVDTGLLVLPVEVSVRGKFRRKECDLPPIKLEFKKGDLKDKGLKKADSYKLVTHCVNHKRGTQYLLKEYSAYQMYNVITDSSFQTQYFPINYVNSRTNERISNYAMLIESNEELEDRLGGKFDDDFGSTVDSVDAYTMEMTALFNYMIGNLDMNLATCHNVKLLKLPNQYEKLTIPYDFDFSLYVNAKYAFPKVDDNRSIVRKYNGYRKNAAYFTKALERYLNSEKKFMSIIKSLDDLKGSHRGECLRYIDDFYYRLQSNDYKVTYEQ